MAAVQTTSVTFQIINVEIYVPVAILSINIISNLYKTTTETKRNNLAYLINPNFRNINRLFVLSLIINGKKFYDKLLIQI